MMSTRSESRRGKRATLPCRVARTRQAIVMSVAARTRQAGCHWLVAHTAAAAASATAAIVDGDTQCVMPVHCRWSTERVGFKRAASPSQQSHWQQSLRSGSRMGGGSTVCTRRLPSRRSSHSLPANAVSLLSWRVHPRHRLPQQLTPCLLLRAPLRLAGPPAAARLRHHGHSSVHSPAESCQTAEAGKCVGQADMRAPEPPLRAPHPILGQRVHPLGREEEGDAGFVAIVSRRMQRGPARLQGRGGGDGRRRGDVRVDATGLESRAGGARGVQQGSIRCLRRVTLNCPDDGAASPKPRELSCIA